MWRNNLNFSACPTLAAAYANRMPGAIVAVACAAGTNVFSGGMNDSQKREVLRLCHQRYLRLRRAAAAGGDVLPDEPEQPSLF